MISGRDSTSSARTELQAGFELCAAAKEGRHVDREPLADLRHDAADLIPRLDPLVILEELGDRLAGLLFQPGEPRDVGHHQFRTVVPGVENDGGISAASDAQVDGDEGKRGQNPTRMRHKDLRIKVVDNRWRLACELCKDQIRHTASVMSEATELLARQSLDRRTKLRFSLRDAHSLSDVHDVLRKAAADKSGLVKITYTDGDVAKDPNEARKQVLDQFRANLDRRLDSIKGPATTKPAPAATTQPSADGGE